MNNYSVLVSLLLHSALSFNNKATKNFLCSDGSMVARAEDCEVFSGCTSGSLPFACSDGSCAESSKKCNLRFSKEQAKVG